LSCFVLSGFIQQVATGLFGCFVDCAVRVQASLPLRTAPCFGLSSLPVNKAVKTDATDYALAAHGFAIMRAASATLCRGLPCRYVPLDEAAMPE
jgi:hypothetical protein